jgi:hypothetical protein
MRLRHAGIGVGAVAVMLSAAAPALDFTLGVGPTFSCQGSGPGARVAGLTFLEPAPVLSTDEYGGRHYDPDDGNNAGVGTGYADLTTPVGQYCAGIFYRTDYYGNASRDTLDALVANHRREPFDVGRTYELEFSSTQLDMAGLKLSRVWRFEPGDRWSLQLGVTASVMKALRYREEHLRGSAIATSGRYAVGTATLVRTESDYDPSDFNPFVGTGDPEGYGYSLDAGAVLRSPRGDLVTATVLDAYSAIHWNDVPESIENADNETFRYDANFNRQAFVAGRDRRVSLTHQMDPRYRLALSVPLQRGFSLIASDDFVNQTHFPAAGVGYGWSGSYAELSVDLQAGAVSILIGHEWLRLTISADDLDVSEATVLGAGLSIAVAW